VAQPPLLHLDPSVIEESDGEHATRCAQGIEMDKRTRTAVWILLTFAAIALAGLPFVKVDQWEAAPASIIIGCIVVAWLGVNEIRIGRNDSLTFVHAITLFLGLTLGPYPAIVILAIGLILIVGVVRLTRRCRGFVDCWSRIISLASRQLLSLAGGMAIYITLGGQLVSGRPSLPGWFPTIGLVVTFSLLFISLHAVQRWLLGNQAIARADAILISLIALIPIPIVIIGAVLFSVFSQTALIIYGAMLVLAAPAFRALIEVQTGLARKSRSLSALIELATTKDLKANGKSYYALLDLALFELDMGDYAALFLNDPSGRNFSLVHTFNFPINQASKFNTAVSDRSFSPTWTNRYEESPYIDDISELPTNLRGILHPLDIHQFAIFELRTGDGSMGQLWLFFRQGHEISQNDIEQLQLFTDQLSRTIDLSREFASTNAELKRKVEQLARLESIGRQVTSSIAIEDVYETIVYHGIQGTSATDGQLEIVNPISRILEPVTSEASEIDFEDEQANTLHLLAQRAFETGQVTNVPDTRTDPEFGTEELKPQSLLFTPIISNGETIGVITLRKKEAEAFTDEEEAFVIQLASQAANALRNALMYEELHQRLKEQSLLYQASAQIAESLDTETISLALADSLAFAINADKALLYRYSANRGPLDFIIGIDGKATISNKEKQHTLGLEIPGVKACIDNRRPIQWSSSEPPTEVDAAHLESFGGGTILLLPLIVGQRTLGLVELIRKDICSFDEEELRTAQSIAIQASIILENSELFQQISQSNNRLSAVLNSTREGMLMIDKDGKIAVANIQLEDLLDVDPDRIAGSNLSSLDDEITQRLGYRRKEIEELISSIRSGKGHLPGISTYEISKGERQVLRRLEAPVHDSAGQLIGWLIVIRDVSEEIQLEESRKHLTEMIVHDLRSPLSAILNSMELLRMQLEDQEQSAILQQALAIADRSVHQMLGLVNALLDLSKLESGQFALASNKVDFHELVPHLIDTFLPEAEQAGVILDYHIDPELPSMMLDEEKIFRVLSNLIDNALKFTPAGGKVTLQMEQNKEQLIIEVSDTGPGIPNEFREQIFNLYAQVPGTEGRRRGTGLGLAFCKLAVEAHQGEIWVEDNPSGGSRFILSLPIEQA
jgi:NtrC-family two-component system sensor histidine kinase KinB